MRNPDSIPQKIISRDEAIRQAARWRKTGKTFAFSNGCFDILHRGHIFSLSAAAREADFLVVGVNSDQSAKKLKGDGRPVNPQDSRALMLASLEIVDVVVIFDEDTPQELISALLPDVLVKGGDYKLEEIVGAREVMANGGRVVINPLVEGISTTAILDKIVKLG